MKAKRAIKLRKTINIFIKRNKWMRLIVSLVRVEMKRPATCIRIAIEPNKNTAHGIARETLADRRL